MEETYKRTIQGKEFQFNKFGAKQSTRYLAKIMKFVGEPIAMAVGAATKDGGKPLLEREMDMEVLAKAVGSLMGRFDDPEVLNLIIEISSTPGLLCDGMRVDFDSFYMGKLDLLLEVVKAALEVQYGNFFGAVTAYLPGQMVGRTPQTTA